MTLEGKSVIIKGTLSVIQSASEESIPVMRKTVRRHQSHRFFTPCHCSVSRFSLKAFSTPFRMTLEGKSVIIKGTLSVIQSLTIKSQVLQNNYLWMTCNKFILFLGQDKKTSVKMPQKIKILKNADQAVWYRFPDISMAYSTRTSRFTAWEMAT